MALARTMLRLRAACLVRARVAVVVATRAFATFAFATFAAATFVAATLVAATLRAVEAQDVSNQPITLIVACPAGGAADAMARRLAQEMSESLHTTVSVANRPGETLLPAVRNLTSAPPDGHTLLFLSSSTVVAHLLHPDDRFDLTALAPVTQVAAGPLILATPKSFPVTTLGNVIAYAKADPHRLVFAAGGGAESAAYLAARVLKAKTGIDVALVPYKGGGSVLDNLLGGHIDVVLDAMRVIGPRAKVGTLKPLAVTSATRFPALPDVLTVMEAGVPDFQIVSWFGILAPANTPSAIAKRLRDEVAKALATSNVVEELDRQGMQPVASEAEEWHTQLKNELEYYGKLIREADVKSK